jgi:ABC-type uncharacterized transport system ATPase subunit
MQIEFKNISKRFGKVQANHDINLKFASGRIIGILGENGAGKSTLMKILAGYQSADTGEIWLDGVHARYHGIQGALTSGIGMLQQDPLDIPAFTVLENFMYGGLPMPRRQAREKLQSISQRFGFTLDPDTQVAQLSIARRQQLEIVRLLALGVRLLILDEPTTGISAEQKQLLFKTLRELAKQDSVTVLLVSHKLEDVIALCDEVAVLRAGQVVGALTMPATTTQLVHLMFDATITHYRRENLVRQDEPDALTLDKVTLRSGRVTVNDLTLRLKPGEIVGLAGLEGSGQELVLRAAAGLIAPVQGELYVGMQRMTGKSYRALIQAGVRFAAAGRLEEGLIAGLTLTEHVALTTAPGQVIDWQAAREDTAKRISHYQVRGTPESQIETLSGGNQQRVLMAMMPEQPQALILEQPTRGLDVESAGWIWEQLLERRAAGAAILFSSAELDEILEYSDRVIVFYVGQAVEVNDPDAITAETLGYLIGGKTLDAAATVTTTAIS